MDIGHDPFAFSGHSLRRGGTQYYASERRWDIRRICEWGGWSTEYSNLTIVKYLISWNDDPRVPREDFLNPSPPTIGCSICGRTCSCV